MPCSDIFPSNGVQRRLRQIVAFNCRRALVLVISPVAFEIDLRRLASSESLSSRGSNSSASGP
eukprot:9137212-Pyramimonas_sp.AAC.1